MNNNTTYRNLRSAQKRAESMGNAYEWESDYNNHPIAACLKNYSDCIDAEIENECVDYTSILVWLDIMARKINAYCDECRIVGDKAAMYWLNEFRIRLFCDFNRLT